jgi:nitroreductase
MQQGDRVVVVNPRWCSQCGHCVAVCPTGAVRDRFAERKVPPRIDPAALPSAKSLQQLFRYRRSVRDYRDKPVSRNDLEKILQAGQYAPTAGNRQDVHHIVLTTPSEIAALRDQVFPSVQKMFQLFKRRGLGTFLTAMMGRHYTEPLQEYFPLLEMYRERWEQHGDDRMFFQAPALMLVHGLKWDDTVGASCAFVLYQASLMAQVLNIGCCFNGFLQFSINHDRKIRDWLEIPWRHKCYGAMTLGYPKVKYRRGVRRDPPKVTWR